MLVGVPGADDLWVAQRRAMVERQLAARGVVDRRVLDAMGAVPRERFVPETVRRLAYEDRPLPIEDGQTISQPYIVAAMLEAAEVVATDRVLEIGAGTGYSAAVASRLAAHVWTVERHADLGRTAAERLAAEGYDRVTVVVGDGTLGLADAAPFDVIVVTAGAPHVPQPLIDQLADGGRLVIPVGTHWEGQSLVRVRRHGTTTTTEELALVQFVPLIGEHGWPA